MRDPVSAESTRFGKSARIPLVSLHAARARRIHRRVVRIGNDHFVAQILEMPRDPLAFRTRFKKDPSSWSIAEHRGEALATRQDPLFSRGAVERENAELTLAFVQIHPYCVHRRLASVWVRL